ncbi:the ARF-like 2 binding protein BART-domain-containing protein [Entophlyctis helioformis]|nr:the ARF-like 2 binding protein BART-domain-containing protein [Entophlyctis helioformis]
MSMAYSGTGPSGTAIKKSPANIAEVDLGNNDDDIAFESPINSDDARFDTVVGELEDVLMDDAFLKLQTTFFAKHHKHFDDSDENKLEYMDIFQKYTSQIEKYLSKRLSARLPWFSMSAFMEMLKDRPEQTDGGEVFEMLHSLGDFNEFKDLILDYKREQEGRGIDLSGLLAVSSVKTGSSKPHKA